MSIPFDGGEPDGGGGGSVGGGGGVSSPAGAAGAAAAAGANQAAVKARVSQLSGAIHTTMQVRGTLITRPTQVPEYKIPPDCVVEVRAIRANANSVHVADSFDKAMGGPRTSIDAADSAVVFTVANTGDLWILPNVINEGIVISVRKRA